MTLKLYLLHFVWTEEYCQTSPNKNKSPNLWHVTSILVCCIFVLAAAHLQLNRLKLGTMIQRTEVGFISFSSGGFTIATFVNQVHKKTGWSYLCAMIQAIRWKVMNAESWYWGGLVLSFTRAASTILYLWAWLRFILKAFIFLWILRGMYRLFFLISIAQFFT